MEYVARYTLDDGKTGAFNVHSYKPYDAQELAEDILKIRHPKQKVSRLFVELSAVESSRLQQEPDKGLDSTGDDW